MPYEAQQEDIVGQAQRPDLLLQLVVHFSASGDVEFHVFIASETDEAMENVDNTVHIFARDELRDANQLSFFDVGSGKLVDVYAVVDDFGGHATQIATGQ